jgi:prephenate dehydratase
LASGELGFGFVPLRNSIAGDYEQTTAAVKAGSVVTVATVAYPIRLAVGIHPDTVRTAITEIWSKDIAMQQCSRYLDKNFPMATRVAVESTATAMWWIRERGLKCVAAVGSENGLGRYGLKVVDIGVEDLPNNVTTFVLLKQNR